MRRSGIFIVVGLLCLGFVSSAASQEKKQEKQKKESISPAARQLESTDITAEVQRMNNSEKFAGPPVPVRPGKVVPRVQDVGTFKDTAKGFTIQLPSKAPIPTPTVYKGKIYVSGGFQSREFYCFDAVSGKLVWAVDLDDDGPTSAVCENDICVFNTESCTIFAPERRHRRVQMVALAGRSAHQHPHHRQWQGLYLLPGRRRRSGQSL